MSLSSLAIAFGAGLTGSVGPCAAPRYVAVTGIAGGSTGATRIRVVAAFIAGVVIASTAAVFSSALLIRALALSYQLYLGLSLAFFTYGAWELLAQREHRCKALRARAASMGGAFTAGAMCALLPSPCCTPVLLGLGWLPASAGLLWSAAVATAFACGHLLPLIGITLGAEPLARAFSSGEAREAARTVGAGLALALGAYYAVLA